MASTAPKATKTEPDVTAPVDFEFKSNKYTIDRKVLTSVSFLEALEDNKNFAFLRAVLGSLQWDQYKARHSDASDLNAFSEAVGEALTKAAGTEGN